MTDKAISNWNYSLWHGRRNPAYNEYSDAALVEHAYEIYASENFSEYGNFGVSLIGND